jgi:hypothetical protein
MIGGRLADLHNSEKSWGHACPPLVITGVALTNNRWEPTDHWAPIQVDTKVTDRIFFASPDCSDLKKIGSEPQFFTVT